MSSTRSQGFNKSPRFLAAESGASQQTADIQKPIVGGFLTAGMDGWREAGGDDGGEATQSNQLEPCCTLPGRPRVSPWLVTETNLGRDYALDHCCFSHLELLD